MAFDLDHWKEEVRKELRGWKDALDQGKGSFACSFLSASALLPIIRAANGGDFTALLEAYEVLKAIGAGMIATRISEWAKRSNRPDLADQITEEMQDDHDLRVALDKLLEKLEVIEMARAELGEEDKEWFEQTLQRELASLRSVHLEAEANGSGRIAQASGEGSRAGAGETVILGDVRGDLHLHQAAASPSILNPQPSTMASSLAKTREDFMAWLVERHRYLDFRGMGVRDLPVQFPLREVYVDLKARIEVPETDTLSQERRVSRREAREEDGSSEEMRVAGRKMSEEELAALGPRLSEPRPLLDLFRESECLIILGDPGAGKTSFLKYLALSLAEGRSGEIGIGPRLPILVPLSAYANRLAKGRAGLKDFLSDYYREDRELDLPLKDLFDDSLEKGDALVLFDGLDEVRDEAQRRDVVERVVDFFCTHRKKGNHFALTSRIVGYREVRPQARGLRECTLLDFDEEDVEAFVTKWTSALEKAAKGQTQAAQVDAERERKELLEAIAHNEGVRGLAANPLLLTILALMKRQGVSLPERRVELYRTYVEALLKEWNAARSLHRGDRQAPNLIETVKVLAPLAFWMQETSPGVGLARREDIERKLVQIYRDRGEEEPEASAQRLLEDVRGHTGLLLERGAGTFGFIHLTFQEYLAAVAIYLDGQKGDQQVIESLKEHLGDDNWHEVSLLAIGDFGINHQQDVVAGRLLEGLIKESRGTPHEARAVILAGEAAVDVGRNGIAASSRKAIVEALLGTMTKPGRKAPASARAEAGRVLGKLGDPRPEVMTLEGMQFCEVPPGPFMIGEGKELHEREVPYPCWMGRYPVTNAQFREFMEAEGYAVTRYWTEAQAAERWKSRRLVDGPIFETEPRQAPADMGEPYSLPNHPVVGVTWYECLAFGRWLTEQWRNEGILPEPWEVRLPSELEWEKAARGGMDVPESPHFVGARGLKHHLESHLPSGTALIRNPRPERVYPWGRRGAEDETTPERANYRSKERRGATNAVGVYPDGASDHGCEEMSGSVFEWTLNKYADYPYVPSDGREILDATSDGRVLRGGCFGLTAYFVRCAYRLWYEPGARYSYVGFRLFCAPISSDL